MVRRSLRATISCVTATRSAEKPTRSGLLRRHELLLKEAQSVTFSSSPTVIVPGRVVENFAPKATPASSWSR
jgi:hypothetical protein